MSTIPIKISTEQLLHAGERLRADELAAFAAPGNLLRARHETPRLSEDATTLLLQINRTGLEPTQQARFEELGKVLTGLAGFTVGKQSCPISKAYPANLVNPV